MLLPIGRFCTTYQVEVVWFGVEWGFCPTVVVVINSDDVVRLSQPSIAELWCEEVGVEEARVKHDDCWT